MITIIGEELSSIEGKVETLSRMIQTLQDQRQREHGEHDASQLEDSPIHHEIGELTSLTGHLSRIGEGQTYYIERHHCADLSREVRELDGLLYPAVYVLEATT